MKEANNKLKNAYYDLLSGQVLLNTVPVLVYKNVPEGDVPDTYILLSLVQNFDTGTKETFMTDTTAQVSIITKRQGDNSGNDLDDIAGQVKELIYPSRQSTPININGFQIKNTAIVTDNDLEELTDGKNKVRQRVIVFQHKILQLN